ncbi:MAG: tryptophan synthase subunit alpha [Dissulfuribacterales bacterium]
MKTPQNRIQDTFNRLEQKNEAAMIPFVTAGDPSTDFTEELVAAMAQNGADIIEIGMPFSDPLADGPVIQAASLRAIEAGMNTHNYLNLIGNIRKRLDGSAVQIPLVFMGYYNMVYQYGLKQFAEDAVSAGLDGAIIPDLPVEEADEWIDAARESNLCTIFLVAPTTPLERLERIAKRSRGFLYYVSVTGITGARQELPAELSQKLAMARKIANLPVAVGFGISRPEQVAMLSKAADGVIVGSAIVRLIEQGIAEGRPSSDLVKQVVEFVRCLKKQDI